MGQYYVDTVDIDNKALFYDNNYQTSFRIDLKMGWIFERKWTTANTRFGNIGTTPKAGLQRLLPAEGGSYFPLCKSSLKHLSLLVAFLADIVSNQTVA